MRNEIDRRFDGESLRGERLWLTRGDSPLPDADIAVSPRIGIDNSGEAAAWPLRFFIRGNAHVSAYRNV